jgi:hypothetical protein
VSKFKEQEPEDPVKKLYFEFFSVEVFVFFRIIHLFFMNKGVGWMIKAIKIYAEILARNPYSRVFKTLNHHVLHLIGSY